MTRVQQLTKQLREREGRLRQREEELKLKNATISRLQREIQRLQVSIIIVAGYDFYDCGHIRTRQFEILSSMQYFLTGIFAEGNTAHSGAEQLLRTTAKVEMDFMTFIIASVLLLKILLTDTTVRVKAPTEAEVEERENLSFWNGYIPKSSGIQGEGVHWRRVCIIR